MPSIQVLLTLEQQRTLKHAALSAGYGLGPWLRGLGMAAARSMGINPIRAARQEQLENAAEQRREARIAHAAEVAARRERRQARKRAIAVSEAAWEELKRCQDAELEIKSSGDEKAIEAARIARVAADAVAVEKQAERDALEA